MGAIIYRAIQVGRYLVLALLIFLAAGIVSAQKQSKRSPHGTLNIPCENCHTNSSWAPLRAIPEFNHDTTKYPLRGMHAKVSCTGCHTKPVFTDVGKDCANCHADIHRAQMGTNCAQCHTVLGWQVSNQSIQQHFNRFPLLGAHAAVQCDACHKNAAVGNYVGLSTACSTCHISDWLGTTNPKHPSAGSAFAASNCTSCHSFDTWLNAKFDHSSTGFLLTNGHANVACALCHVNNNYNLAIAPSDCGNSQCHLTTWRTTTNPVHPSAGAAFAVANCTTCHTTVSWTTATFDHSTTGFLLTAGHANVTCASCHINNNYTLTIAPTDCGNSQCHLTTWQQTNNPIHSTSGTAFAAANCSTCHNTTSWTTAAFNHSTTGLTLTGTHMSPTPTPCTSCHVSNNYTLNSTDCYGCHTAAFQSTTTIGGNVPNHVTAGFPTTASACATCHPITTWAAGVFDHNAAGFPLTNGHAGVTCALCHINNNYALAIAPTDCGNSGCHLSTWQGTNNPVHSTSGAAFAAANCSTCHTTVGWDAASFDHSVTGFTLTGTHMSPTPTPCASCHISNNYTLNSADCYGCHTAAFQSTTTIGGNVPNHVTAGFPTTASACSTCHPITTWAAGVFDHNATGFPLTNAHAGVTCALCHINNNYALSIAPTDCGNSGCHLSTNYGGGWQGTTAPPHASAGPAFAVANCSTCHTTVTFLTATFDHSTTGFALTGTHVSPTPTPCASCHISNNYSLSSTDCYGCHSAAFQSTTTIGGSVPNHITAGFPTTASQCASCHPITTWAAGVFNHASTGFPLTNSHAPVACALCHINGNYALSIAPTDCGNSGCHLNTNYGGGWQGTNAPSHSAAGPLFAVANCTNCHTTVSFTTATFDHSTTGFALTGMHISPSPTPCASCHVGNNYSLSSTACYGCHTTDWNSTATLGGAVPNHITSGFPTDCSICHSTTNWTTSTFNHSTTTFPLTGAHTTVACALCHVNSNYSGTLPTDCYGCHTTDWQSTTTLGGSVPNHISSGYPTTCASCHTTTSWLGATFNHSTTGFPLTGAHVTVACNLCHTSSAVPPTDCYSCHTADWKSTATLGGSVPDHTGNGFPAASTCSTCHTTTAWTGATFTHSWWRIPHNSATCQTCHRTPGAATNFATFNCTNGCHTPESSWQQQSGRHNSGNYGPMTCTASGCHPNG
ncbi:MAG TPA: hypothetical protein VHS29_07590 [Candidatus Acidoferrales bacterium]|nr:hypothetical protein [Candidatus Acidoferrales bacterium]